MTAYARLLGLLTLRRLAEGLRGRTGITLGILFLVALLALLEASSATPPPPATDDGTTGGPAGIIVLAAFAVVGGFGPYSTRLPHTPADIHWVHTAPIGIRTITLMTLAHRCLLRTGVWAVAAALLAIAYAVQSVPLDRLPSTAASQALFIAALTMWSVGSGVARGSRSLTIAALAIAALMGATAVAAGIASVDAGLEGTALRASERVAGHLADALSGQLTTSGLVILLAVGAIGVAFTASATAATRERLVLDSAYWANLDMRAMFGSATPIPSWRGGSRLTGPWALLWYEIAVLRHARFNRVALLGTVAIAAVMIALDPALLTGVPLWYGFIVLIGVFATGTALHLRLGTLQAVPGPMSARIAAVELPHLVHTSASMMLVLLAAAFAAGEPVGQALALLPSGLSVLAVALGTRLLAVAIAARGETQPDPARLAVGLVGALVATFLTLASSVSVLQLLLGTAASLTVGAWLIAVLASAVAVNVLAAVLPHGRNASQPVSALTPPSRSE